MENFQKLNLGRYQSNLLKVGIIIKADARSHAWEARDYQTYKGKLLQFKVSESVFKGAVYVGMLNEDFCDIYLVDADGDLVRWCLNVPVFFVVDALGQGFAQPPTN